MDQNPKTETNTPIPPTFTNSVPSPDISVGLFGSVDSDPVKISTDYINQMQPTSEKKPSKWRYFFIVIGVLQVLCVSVSLLIMLLVAGQTGSEFIALGLFFLLIPVVSILTLANVIGLPIYMYKHKPRGKSLVFSILSLVLSILLILYFAVSIVMSLLVISKYSEQAAMDYNSQSGQYAVVNSKTNADISKEAALTLLQDCKVDYFVGYTGDASAEPDKNTVNWLNHAEQSSSGLAVSQKTPKTYLFASKSMTAQLQDTARQYRLSCYDKKKLVISIDGWVETEYPQGTWTKVKR